MVKRGDSPYSGCVEDADLHAALDGELSDAALELVHVHVASCASCGGRLRAVRDERQQVTTVLGQEDEHEGEAVLASVARIERAMADALHRPKPARRGSILKRLGLAMAAAAILLCAALGVAYVTSRGFERLAGGFIIGIWPFYALAVGAVFIMRRRRPDLHRPYRTFGYPLVPLVFLLASILMLGNSVIEDTAATLLNFGIILLGIPVYYIWIALRGRKHG
jgi:amino acid transporter